MCAGCIPPNPAQAETLAKVRAIVAEPMPLRTMTDYFSERVTQSDEEAARFRRVVDLLGTEKSA